LTKYIFALVAAALLVPTVQPVPARAAYVKVDNRTHNSWVWVTAYNQFGKIVKAWCVSPNRDFGGRVGTELSNLRGEVTVRNCQHPRAADLRCPYGLAHAGIWNVVLTERGSSFNWSCRLG